MQYKPRERYKWPAKKQLFKLSVRLSFYPATIFRFFFVPRPQASWLSYYFSDLSASEVVSKVDEALEHKVRHKVDWCINGVQLEQLTCEAVRSAARWVCHCCKSTTSIPCLTLSSPSRLSATTFCLFRSPQCSHLHNVRSSLSTKGWQCGQLGFDVLVWAFILHLHLLFSKNW